jgi:hypothetical protein
MKPRLLIAGVLAFVMITGLGVLMRWPAWADSGAQPATAQGDLGLVHLAQVDVGGSAYAVTAQGDYAYVAVRKDEVHPTYSLVIADISVPTAPRVVGHSVGTGDVVVTGTHAYFTDGYGLHVLDVSDPTAPVEDGSYDVKRAYYLFVLNSTAYVVVFNEGFYILDISDPTAPRQLGVVPVPDNGGYPADLRAVIARGRYAYALGNQGLTIFDVSDPAHAREVGRYPPPPYGFPGYEAAYLSGDYIYALIGWGGHGGCAITSGDTINISDAAQPQRVAGMGDVGVGAVLGISGAGTHVYVTAADDRCHPGGLHVLDISNPAAPQEILFYALRQGRASDVSARGDTVFLAEEDSASPAHAVQGFPAIRVHLSPGRGFLAGRVLRWPLQQDRPPRRARLELVIGVLGAVLVLIIVHVHRRAVVRRCGNLGAARSPVAAGRPDRRIAGARWRAVGPTAIAIQGVV